jgi:tetratricopeptide (TPR) repeat protein
VTILAVRFKIRGELVSGLFNLTLIVSALLTVSPALSASPPDPVPEIDRLFSYGADPGSEKQALEIAERALKGKPNDYELLWRAARSYYYTADGVAARDRLPYYNRGIAVGSRAVDQKTGGVEGHFWLAANYGGYCREKSGLPPLGTVKKVREGMETVLRLNDRYEEGSAYVALGEIDRQLPKLFGGDDKRAVARLEQGLKIAPQNLEMKLALAEAYLDSNRKTDARRQLEEMMKLPLSPARTNESRRAQEKARSLLTKLGG